MQILIMMLFVLLFFRSNKYVVFCFNQRKVNMMHISYLLMFVVLTFFLIFRFEVGYDYNQYYRYFRNFKGAQYFELYGHLVYYLADKLGSPWFIFTLYGIPTMVFYYLAIKENSEDKWMSVMLFTTMFYLDCMSMIRQCLAVAIVVYAFKFVKIKKFIPFLVWILVASLSHTTALVAIPIYFIYNYSELKYILIFDVIVVVFANRIMLFLIEHVSIFSRFSVYYTSGIQGGRSVRIFYLILFLVILFIYFATKNNFEDNEEIPKYINVVAMGFALTFSFLGSNGTRLAIPYNVIYIFLIPSLCSRIFNRVSYIISIVPFVVYYCLFLIIDANNLSGYTPYKFFF